MAHEQEIEELEREIAGLREEVQQLEAQPHDVEQSRKELEQAQQRVAWYDTALELMNNVLGVEWPTQEDLPPDSIRFLAPTCSLMDVIMSV